VLVMAIKVDSVIMVVKLVQSVVKEKSSSRSHCPTGDNHFVIAEV
jgi:hypothetical protein